MFPMFKSDAALRVYKLTFCENAERHTQCARFKLASAGTMPEPDLLPDGTRLPAHWRDDAET